MGAGWFAGRQGVVRWKRCRVGSEKIGWGGRIRTSTVLINSEVSYRLDHAPAAFVDPDRVRVSRKWVAPLQNRAAGVLLRYHAPRISQAPLPQEFICPFRALVHLDIRKEIQPKENGRKHDEVTGSG